MESGGICSQFEHLGRAYFIFGTVMNNKIEKKKS